MMAPASALPPASGCQTHKNAVVSGTEVAAPELSIQNDDYV